MNSDTVKNRYPLPLVSSLLDRLRHAKIFSKIDLRGAYNLLRIRKGDEWLTAFRSRFGHFEYLVVPFGLANAPAAFQHMMNDIFKQGLDIFIVIYLDDILIFSRSLDEHQHHVTFVLKLLRKHRLYAKLEKCSFHTTSIEFLGFMISPAGITMAPSKTKDILSWPAPRSVIELQSFLGFANFYRKFIFNFSSITTPLTDLTKKNVKFNWSSAHQLAFDSLKKSFTTAPLLRHFDPALPMVVEADASDFGQGAVLSQMYDDGLHPIAFWSKKFAKEQMNLTTFRLLSDLSREIGHSISTNASPCYHYY